MQSDEKARLSGSAVELSRTFLAPFRAGGVLCLVVFAISASIALGWSKVRGAQVPVQPARVAVWLSDRDGDQVYGLDRELLVVSSVALRAPIEVEARADGGAWIVSSIDADPLGPHRLLRLLHDGRLAARAPTWWRALFRRAGWSAMGMHLYLPTPIEGVAAALERAR